MKKKAAEIAATFEKQGMSAADAMKKAWQQITDDAVSGSAKAKNSISGIKSAFSSLGSTVSKFGGMLASVLGPISFIWLAKECIELGSSVNEVQNVVDTAFGSMAHKMEAFADSAITNFGMSELAAKKTGSTLMAMAKGIGIAEGAASEMAITLTGMTGDVASFFNISQDAAATKLKSVFTGETESLKELGVVMTQTNLEQYALSKGISKSISAMTQAELATLRYHFVLDSLNLASGDFVKTQDSWANQTRILTMQIQALGANIGSILTTVLVPAVKVLNEIVANLVSATSMISAAISSIFGVQISQNSQIASSAADAAAAENELAAGIGKAAKAAKKSLAGFDELNILQSNTDGGSGGIGSGGGFGLSVSNETSVAPITGSDSSPFGAWAERLKEIDLSPLKESLAGLQDAFRDFADVLSGVFSWAWDNILVPLAEWCIEKAAPATVDALSAAFEGLASTVSVVFDTIQECWDELRPIFQWIGDTVLVVLEDLKEIGQGVAKKWEENRDKLKKTFENIGEVIQKLWTVVGPIFTWIRNAISTVAVGLPLNELQLFFDRLYAISEILAGLFSGDFKQVLNGFGAAIAAETEYGEAQIKTFARSIGIDLNAADQWVKQAMENIGQWFANLWQGIVDIWGVCAEWFNTAVIQPIAGFFSGLWEGISTAASTCWNAIVEFFSPAIEWFSELFNSVWQTISDIFYNIGVIASGCWEIIKAVWAIVSEWFDTNIIQPVAGFFTDLWTSISNWAIGAWENIKAVFSTIGNWINTNIIQPVSNFFSGLWNGFLEKARAAWEGVKTVFGKVASFFSDTFKKAWAGIVKVFSVAGEIFNDIKDGILTAFKSIVNGIIKGLNSAIAVPFNGINTALRAIKNIKILDLQPFAGLRTISVPQIPYLAQGAVLPPNKPFMAVVGDQKHGTNIEAPLTTIQEAVAAVMGDNVSAMVAGFNALLEENRLLRETVESISIGDETLYEAVRRYSNKMTAVTGSRYF